MTMADADGDGEEKLLVGSDDFEVRGTRQRASSLEETPPHTCAFDLQCRNPRMRRWQYEAQTGLILMRNASSSKMG